MDRRICGSRLYLSPLGTTTPIEGYDANYTQWDYSITYTGTSLQPVYALSSPITVVPEPAALTLLLPALLGLGFLYLRRRRAKAILRLLLAAALLASAVLAQADVFNMGGTISGGTWTGLASLQFVTVGNAGNLPDPASNNLDGSVPYTYRMGEYNVTLAQYTQFLNAVAQTDPYGLYNSYMSTNFQKEGISRSGNPGSFSYSVTGSAPNAANMPVFCVTWGDAARFCNWLDRQQLAGRFMQP